MQPLGISTRVSSVIASVCLLANLGLSVCLFKGIHVPYLFDWPNLYAGVVLFLLLGFMFFQKRDHGYFPSWVEGCLCWYFCAALIVYGENFQQVYNFYSRKVFYLALIALSFFGLYILWSYLFRDDPPIFLLVVLVFSAFAFYLTWSEF